MRDALRTALVFKGAVVVPRTFGSIGGVARFRRTRMEELKPITFKVARTLVELAFALSELVLFLLELKFGQLFDALLASSYFVLIDGQIAWRRACRGIRWETIHDRGCSSPRGQGFVHRLVPRCNLGNTHR